MKFDVTIRLDGKTATGIEVPAQILTGLGGGKRPRVKVTINGYTYRSTVGSMGGRSLVPVSADVRARAGVKAGDRVAVDIAAETEERTVTVPADLARALETARARKAFDQLSYSNRHRHVYAVEDARTPETRQRRIDKAVNDVLAGS